MSNNDDYSAEAEILKVDDEKRLVYGFVTVYEENGEPLVDRQGDMISEDEVLKMAHRFIDGLRESDAMHDETTRGKIVETVVLTRDLQKALGIDLGRAGWLIASRIDDDETWAKVKSRDYKGFSIGGKGVRCPLPDEQ